MLQIVGSTNTLHALA